MQQWEPPQVPSSSGRAPSAWRLEVPWILSMRFLLWEAAEIWTGWGGKSCILFRKAVLTEPEGLNTALHKAASRVLVCAAAAVPVLHFLWVEAFAWSCRRRLLCLPQFSTRVEGYVLPLLTCCGVSFICLHLSRESLFYPFVINRRDCNTGSICVEIAHIQVPVWSG